MEQSPSIDTKELLPFIKVIYYDTEKDVYALNSEELENILLTNSIQDKHVAVISVAGAYRRGKSFLLNFFIRYLKYVQDHGFSKDGDISWMGSPEEQLQGFPWRGGSERETDGILLWREPFLIDIPGEGQIVVLLMDTQGAFDSTTTVKDCATIFAISTMISSIQVYNVSGNLQEDYLDHLQLFTEYGRIALESSDSKPFQDLLFLVRDWSYPYEFDYGYSSTFLDKKLTVSEHQPKQLQYVRNHIRDCFENVHLFLLPHPGVKVATTPTFKGNVGDMEDTFKLHLSQLVTSVISSSQIKPKISHGNPISCKNLIMFFKSYIKIFQSNELPEPKSMLMATAEANHLVALNAAKQVYYEQMDELVGSEKAFMPNDILNTKHDEFFEDAINYYTRFKKMGGETILIEYREKLEYELLQSYEHFCAINSNKRVNSLKFMTLAVVICVISFVISQFLDLVGLDPLMLPFQIFSFISILLVFFCLYVQFFGGFTQVMYYLNILSDSIILMVQSFAINRYLRDITSHKKNT